MIPQTVTNTVDSNLDTHKSVKTGLEKILLPYGRPVQRNFTKFSDHANVDSTSLLLGASHSQCLDLIPTDDDREVFKTTLKRGQELLIVVRHQLQEEKAGEARCLYGRFMGVKPVTLPCGLVRLDIYFLVYQYIVHRHITFSICTLSIHVEQDGALYVLFRLPCSVCARMHSHVVWRGVYTCCISLDGYQCACYVRL